MGTWKETRTSAILWLSETEEYRMEVSCVDDDQWSTARPHWEWQVHFGEFYASGPCRDVDHGQECAEQVLRLAEEFGT